MSNPIKPTLKSEFFSWLIIAATIAASVYFYFNLPERIPVHWNFAGEVDRYGSGRNHAVFFPILIVGLYLLLLLVPYLDPKKERYEQFARPYAIFRLMILFVITVIYFLSSLAGLGYDVSIAVWVPLLIGALFVVLGNYMGKIKPNWFVGIRTPWTLSSELVWNKTHRFGGKMFIIAGLLLMAEGLWPVKYRLPILMVAVILASLVTFVYSYIIYKQEEKRNKQ